MRTRISLLITPQSRISSAERPFGKRLELALRTLWELAQLPQIARTGPSYWLLRRQTLGATADLQVSSSLYGGRHLSAYLSEHSPREIIVCIQSPLLSLCHIHVPFPSHTSFSGEKQQHCRVHLLVYTNSPPCLYCAIALAWTVSDSSQPSPFLGLCNIYQLIKSADLSACWPLFVLLPPSTQFLGLLSLHLSKKKQ